MSYNEGMSPADYAAITGNNNRNNDGMFGDGGWFWIIILLAALGLFGGNGFGGGGGFGGGRCGSPCATQADVRDAVDQQTLISKLDQQTYGIADSTYALNNTIMNGFHGVDNAICNLGYQTQQGFNNLGYQMKDCCCETQRLIERGFCDTNRNISEQFCETRHQSERNTRDIIDNQNANSRALMDFLVQDKISTLQSENQALKFKASQAEQNAYLTATIDASRAELVRRLGADCPTPAYVVQPPTPVSFPTNCCGQVQFANNGCGCGNGYGF